MNKQQTVIILLVIVLVLGFFGWNEGWLANLVPTQQEVISPKEYKNSELGFSVTLPDSWVGYTSATTVWKGYSLDAKGETQADTEIGPMIFIRHPLWKAEAPRQDIPVMVFTIKQWNDMQADKFHIGAAPINPSELARNATYVFALPARYNFAYLTGFEEVDQIIRNGNVQAF